MQKRYLAAVSLVVVCGCLALPSLSPTRPIISKASVDRIKAGMSQNEVIAALGRCADVAAPCSQGSDCFWVNNDKSRAVIKFDFDFHVISAEWQPAPGAGSNEKRR